MSPPVLFGRADLDAAVRRLGRTLSADYDDGVVLVGLLKGSVVFLADLVRAMTITPEIDFLAISAFADGGGRARLVKDLEVDIAGRDVVLVEAVVDTGLSLSYLLGELGGRRPRSLAVCTLLDKTSRRLVPVELRYVGFATEAAYVVGYGLDHAGRYANATAVLSADPVALAAAPDALVPALYGRG